VARLAFNTGNLATTESRVTAGSSRGVPLSLRESAHRVRAQALSHFDERSELIQIEAAHGYKRCLLFPSNQ
jgi:hypothetical protein